MQVLQHQMHNKRQECPAYRQKCHKCKKKENNKHFASVCISKRSNQEKAVKDENDLDSDLSVLTLHAISTITQAGKQVIVKLTFCIQDNTRCPWSANWMLVPRATWSAIKIFLSYCRTDHLHLTRDQPSLDCSMDQCTLGETCLTAEYERKMAHSKVSTVANGPNKPLLSAGAWEQMGLVKFKINSLECINVEESMAEHPLSKETVLSTYKGVFDGFKDTLLNPYWWQIKLWNQSNTH